MERGAVEPFDTGGKYRPPFGKADREAEMTHAYEVFAARLRERAPDYVVPSSQ